MKSLKLTMLAAGATLAASIGGASAMPLNGSLAVQNDSLVENARVVCDNRGRCWNTNNRRSTRYVQPRYVQPHYGYHQQHYGYHQPGVGVGVGPVGIWVR